LKYISICIQIGDVNKADEAIDFMRKLDGLDDESLKILQSFDLRLKEIRQDR